VIEARVEVIHIFNEAEGELIHVHRFNSQQEWCQPNLAFAPTQDVEVKDTEAGIVV
jgi:hypothetical protein